MVAIRKAHIEDVARIHALLLSVRESDGLVLPRSVSQLYSHLRDFFVVIDDANEILGCCALNIIWDNLAEIRSLMVSPDARKGGYGRKLVDACLGEAKDLGINVVYTLTDKPQFFGHLGFVERDKEGLNQKIWSDCLNCPRFPDFCNESAMVIEL